MDQLLPPECYTKYFDHHEFLDKDCFKIISSKLAGLSVMLTAFVAKIPQIMKIYENKSGEGVNLPSVTLELLSYTIYMAYSFSNDYPFHQWGEVFFLMLQTLSIVSLMLHYDEADELAAAYVASYVLLCCMMFKTISNEVLLTMQSANILIFTVAKSLQIYSNYENGHTGQLSEATLTLQFTGCVLRVFTSVQDTGDPVIIANNVIASVTNGILLGQLWYYSDITQLLFEI